MVSYEKIIRRFLKFHLVFKWKLFVSFRVQMVPPFLFCVLYCANLLFFYGYLLSMDSYKLIRIESQSYMDAWLQSFPQRFPITGRVGVVWVWSTPTSKDFKPTSKDFSMVKQGGPPCFPEHCLVSIFAIGRISLKKSITSCPATATRLTKHEHLAYICVEQTFLYSYVYNTNLFEAKMTVFLHHLHSRCCQTVRGGSIMITEHRRY